ncbi:protein of unknown function [Nitrosotalea devaniterrae]|uniref:Uncharacterized protein n=1 Tax=Nitrosotalea devaniterrae TaxID=1078905 RepID=A0A128A5B9_9ARCH|nr:protein of unknown function [Candidatus Nitrosotalea devanaterra]
MIASIFRKFRKKEMFPGSDSHRVIGTFSLNPHLVLLPGCPVARLGGPKIIFHHPSPSACILGRYDYFLVKY